MTAEAITRHLHTTRLGRKLLIEPSVDSTNTQVKQRFGNEDEGFVLLAEEQTAGRGRLGRQFVSPAGSGLYMSIVLHPDLPLERISLLMLILGCLDLRSARAAVRHLAENQDGSTMSLSADTSARVS